MVIEGQRWATEVSADARSGSVSAVHGTDAWIVAPEANWAGSPGSVEFVLNGIDVTLIEHGELTTDDLVRIADSIA